MNFSAPGYRDKTVENIEVSDLSYTVCNVALVPDSLPAPPDTIPSDTTVSNAFLAGAGSLERTWDGLARLADPGRGRRRGPGKRALAGLLLCGAVLLVCVLLEYWALPALVGAAAGFVL